LSAPDSELTVGLPGSTGEEEETMGVQTDLRAGYQCYKCGFEIELEIELEFDIDLFGNCKPRHKSCN
jgi:hypothetical protein